MYGIIILIYIYLLNVFLSPLSPSLSLVMNIEIIRRKCKKERKEGILAKKKYWVSEEKVDNDIIWWHQSIIHSIFLVLTACVYFKGRIRINFKIFFCGRSDNVAVQIDGSSACIVKWILFDHLLTKPKEEEEKKISTNQCQSKSTHDPSNIIYVSYF